MEEKKINIKTYPSIGVFGFPKSGNTWVGNTFLELGRIKKPGFQSPFDVHMCVRESIQLNPNPGLDIGEKQFVCFKSHSPRYYKRAIPVRFKELGIGELEKLIILTRNPFDVLLSFINYSQFEVASYVAKGEDIPFELQRFITDYIGIERDDISVKWSRGMTFEVLRDMGYLEKALESFGRYGLSIPMVYRMSSTWSSNILSWKRQMDVPSLIVRYEDLINNLKAEVVRIASFLDIDSTDLHKAFEIRNQKTLAQKEEDKQSKNPSFYNKMTSGYFRDYFSDRSLLEFYNKHFQLLEECGYDDLNI